MVYIGVATRGHSWPIQGRVPIPSAMSMRPLSFLVAFGAVFAAGAVVPAEAARRDQDAAFEAVRSGRSKPLPVLERRVLPQIRGDYLGRPEYDPSENMYRMKFMRGGSVIWIDVDGRTGQIIRRSGE